MSNWDYEENMKDDQVLPNKLEIAKDKFYAMFSGMAGLRLTSRDEFDAVVDALVAAVKDENKLKTCFNCGGPVNVSSGYVICDRGCGGPVTPPKS